MKQTRRSGWLAGAIVASACAAALPARAMVTLETNLSDITCGITGAAGETLFSDCNGMSFAARIEPGQTAFLRGTLNYHYTDDGLPLPYPQGIQGDAAGFLMIPVTFEVGALYFGSNDCSDSRYCNTLPGLIVSGTRFTPPLVLGLNDQADDITGSKALFVTVGVAADTPFGFSSTLFVSHFPVLFSAPVPEPATLALMAGGLLLTSLMLGRRRVRGVVTFRSRRDV